MHFSQLAGWTGDPLANVPLDAWGRRANLSQVERRRYKLDTRKMLRLKSLFTTSKGGANSAQRSGRPCPGTREWLRRSAGEALAENFSGRILVEEGLAGSVGGILVEEVPGDFVGGILVEQNTEWLCGGILVEEGPEWPCPGHFGRESSRVTLCGESWSRKVRSGFVGEIFTQEGQAWRRGRPALSHLTEIVI